MSAILQLVLLLSCCMSYVAAQQYSSLTELYVSPLQSDITGVSYQLGLSTTQASTYYNVQLLQASGNSPTIASAILHYTVTGSDVGQLNVPANAENANYVYTVVLHPGSTLTYSFTYFLTTGPAYDTQPLTITTASQGTPATTAPTTLTPTVALTTPPVTTKTPTTAVATTITPTTKAPTTAAPTTVSPTTPTATILKTPSGGGGGAPASITPSGPFGTNLIWSDEFNTLDLGRWKHAITAGGGGNWEFEYYTNNRSNSYVTNGVLYLQPTLTSMTLGSGTNATSIQNGGSLNLWGSEPASQCTSEAFWGCQRTGYSYNPLNPIQSASIRTAETFSFKYGRMEVRAKLPLGDWLWPAIWLLPKNQQYGAWPASGEIDIMESRGNAPSYPYGGVNQFGSTLHFGPFAAYNGHQWESVGYALQNGGRLSDDFHVYGLYWDATGLYTYLDNDSNRILQKNWTTGGTLWNEFSYWQQSNYANPWQSGNGATAGAPFDQEFYIIFNVAVGGTNGYFPLESSGYTSITDFVAKQAQWYSTWGNGTGTSNAMAIDWVRVYQ